MEYSVDVQTPNSLLFTSKYFGKYPRLCIVNVPTPYSPPPPPPPPLQVW